MTASRPTRQRHSAAAAIAFGLGLLLVPLHPTDAAARRPAGGIDLPSETADEDLPVPPIPPVNPPAFSAAPVPDGEPAPTPQATPSKGAQLGPGLFGPQSYGDGNGYLSGSTIQSEQDRRKPPAGLQLSMPLE